MPGHISESVGLAYTIMHFWRFVYFVAMMKPGPESFTTFNFITKAGLFQCVMRILGRCLDRNFLLKDYNRLVPYRALELIFAATQADFDGKEEIIVTVLEEPEKAFDIFYPIICGEISAVEQVLACQLTANLSCFDSGVVWLLDHPQIVGKIGWHLWGTYDLLYRSVCQYEELQVCYMKHQVFSPLEVASGDHSYSPLPLTVADLNTYIVLCCLCNVCATHLEGEEPMERVEPCLLAVVKEGLYDHVGIVSYCIILNDNKYKHLCVEKFLSFLSWSCFQIKSQKVILDQICSLPHHREDIPLFYDKDSYSKSKSVIALLVTHANHLDYEKGSHFVTLAIIYLLRVDEEVAMEVLRWSGDILFDLAHSIHHAHMPSKEDSAVSLKRVVMETMLKFGGSSFFDEDETVVKPSGEGERWSEVCAVCVSVGVIVMRMWHDYL